MPLYRAGTVSITVGSAEAVGADTQFLAEVLPGDILVLASSAVSNHCYEVLEVVDDTTLILDVEASETTADSDYVILRSVSTANNLYLMRKVNEFLKDRQVSLAEFRDWINGTDDGGPNGDGFYPLTDRHGVTTWVKSPQAMQVSLAQDAQDVSDLLAQLGDIAQAVADAQAAAALAASKVSTITSSVTHAQNKAAEADASAVAAAGSASTASTKAAEAVAAVTSIADSVSIATTKASEAASSASDAAASATTAQGAATLADTRATAAGTSATTASTKAGEAASSASAAAQSATTATNRAGEAAASATTAGNAAGVATTKANEAAASASSIGNAETNAVAAAGTATTKAGEADASATLAQKWANHPEDSPVEGGEYSAYHWSKKAQQAAGGGVTSVNGQAGVVTLGKADVGLGNVDNTADADKPVSTDQATALAGKVDTSVSVTAGNGLTGGGTLAQTRTITLGTPGTLTGSTDNAVTSTGHTHKVQVTKADVGLGNVDNTSDANKPVSTAQANAIGAKLDKANGTATATKFSVSALGNTTGSRAINLSSATEFTMTITGNTTFSFTNPPGANEAQVVYLRMVNAGSRTINWPSGTYFPGGAAPTFTASGTDLVGVKFDRTGNRYFVFPIGIDLK